MDVGFQKTTPKKHPRHPLCHCTLEKINYSIVLENANAHGDYSKFDPYLFNTSGTYKHGKDKLFAQWGYTLNDAQWLKTEIERQAKEKYIQGEYIIGKLDFFGQRINITISIPKRNQEGVVSFVSGWMVNARGQLKLNTPYGGK